MRTHGSFLVHVASCAAFVCDYPVVLGVPEKYDLDCFVLRRLE